MKEIKIIDKGIFGKVKTIASVIEKEGKLFIKPKGQDLMEIESSVNPNNLFSKHSYYRSIRVIK